MMSVRAMRSSSEPKRTRSASPSSSTSSARSSTSLRMTTKPITNSSSGTMNTGGGTALPARAPASPATTDRTTMPNHSSGKTRFRKNVWRDEMRLIVMLLRRTADGLIELIAHEPAHGNITHRNKQHAEQRRAQHAADHAGADGVARVGTRTARDHHGEHPQYEGERGHEDRPEAQPCGLQHRIVQAPAPVRQGDREFDDQDRVRGRQADDGDESPLEEHVIRQAAQQ